MRADIQIFISCARKDTIKKEMAGLGEAWQSPTEHGGNLSESFWLDYTASCTWHWVMEGRGRQAFHYQEWVLANVRPDPSQPPFLCAGKPTHFTGQSRALVFSGSGIRKEEGLRSSAAFYSHLPKGGIDLGSSKTLFPPVLLQGPAGQESPWAPGNSGPTSPLCAEGWADSGAQLPWSKHQAEVSLSLQLQHSANHSWFPVQGCLSWAGRLAAAGLCSRWQGGIAASAWGMQTAWAALEDRPGKVHK